MLPLLAVPIASILLVAVPLAPVPACYRHPVPAPVVEGFREPACRWCPGNRGLDYGTRPGDPVTAAAPGRTTFAGMVAGRRWVTVAHADGLRTSYGPLAAVVVRTGSTVVAGQVLGRAGGWLHVGLRRGDRYLDPAAWFGPAVRLRPRLVPLDAPPPEPARPACTGPGRRDGTVR